MTTCGRCGRGFLVKRTFQRTIYRPAELIQCDLWEPSKHVPVGWGQTRRGWVVTSQSCWSRAFAGTLLFSKEAPDILAGLARNLQRLGVRAEKLVWDRESAIAGQLREAHAAVIPGYHLNKRHWNTVIIDGSLPEQTIKALVSQCTSLGGFGEFSFAEPPAEAFDEPGVAGGGRLV